MVELACNQRVNGILVVTTTKRNNVNKKEGTLRMNGRTMKVGSTNGIMNGMEVGGQVE